MRRNATLQFRMEDCLLEKFRAITEKNSENMADVLYKSIWSYLKRKMSLADLAKLEKETEARDKCNGKRGRPRKDETGMKKGKEVKKAKNPDKEAKKPKKEEKKSSPKQEMKAKPKAPSSEKAVKAPAKKEVVAKPGVSAKREVIAKPEVPAKAEKKTPTIG